jgi:ABC-type antimicrobial peptide transport system permease subunit
MVFAGVINPDFSAGAFFTAGGLLLVCLIFLTLDIFNSVITTGKFVLTNDFSLAVKNSGKRKSRSLSVIILISCGTFMITAVGINGNMTVSEPGSRKSGTGGFEVYARSSIGITENLNTDKGRREAGINFSEDLQVRFINCRLHEGDNASCLNLNRPSRPSVMSVEHKKLAELEAFSFNRTIKDAGNVNPWELLEDSAPNDEVIPSIADHSTVMWSLGKKVGDFIEYRNQTGVNLKLKIVATVKNSILQGSIIVSDDSFVRNFPGDSEYRVFLADVEPLNEDNINKVSNILASRLVDYGLQATSTRKRLSMFNSVQNTYISIFELLGALGIILGTVAMGFIVMRNVLARMGELAMMWAIGYNIKKIRRIIFYEHMILFVYGSFTGLAASLVSVYPSLSVSGRDIPYLSITTTLIAIIVSASVWTLLATRLALKKNPLAALRNE